MKIRVDVDFLRELPLDGVDRDIIREVAEEVKEEARDNAPERSGELKRSIRVLDIDGQSAKVGSDLVYAPIHEFGGTIRPNKGEVMRYKIGGQWVSMRGVTIKESRYLRKAARTVEGKVLEIVRRVLKERGIT